MAFKALIIGNFAHAPVALVNAWLKAGNEIAAFWYAETAGQSPVRRDRLRSMLLPHWSITRLSQKYSFPIRKVPRLATWSGAALEASATGADTLISAYFPYLVPPEMLQIFGHRAVNFHPAPLPRYRGPHPIEAMVLDRSVVTDGAMTLHVLSEAFDEGPIIASAPVPFPSNGSLQRYYIRLAQATAALTRRPLSQYLAGSLRPVQQIERHATYAIVKPSELDLHSDMTADEVRWRCRVFGKLRPLKIHGVEAASARSFSHIVGPPSGHPPSVGPMKLSFDTTDARVAVWRNIPHSKLGQSLRHLIELRRLSPLHEDSRYEFQR